MIRVLRIMEYTYDTNERAEEDTARWHIPANGTKCISSGMTIKSATITDLVFKDENGN